MRKVVVNKQGTYNGHKDAVYALEKSNLEHIFFSGAGDGMVVSWDLTLPDQGQLIAKLPNSVYGIHYLKQRDLLAIGHNYDGIHLIDWQNKKEVASLHFTDAAIFDLTSYKDHLFAGDAKGVLYILLLHPLSVINKIQVSQKSIRSIVISHENETIAVGTSDHTIKLYDLNTHALLHTLHAHTNSVFTLRYTPDHQYLISAGRDAHLKVWDVKANYLLVEDIVAHMYAINHIAFSPDGQYFATCSIDKTIKIWDTQRLKLLKVIDKGRHAGHGTSVNKLYWSAYGHLLISASDDRTISVWKIDFEVD